MPNSVEYYGLSLEVAACNLCVRALQVMHRQMLDFGGDDAVIDVELDA